MNGRFEEMLREADSVCILGHISPDGDCLGSTLGLYTYLQNRYPEKKAQVYLEEPSPKFAFLNGFDSIQTENSTEQTYDLCIVCDCADDRRLGKFRKYLTRAKASFLVDHHITNSGFCDENVIEAGASSASELVYSLIDVRYFDRKLAECIYTGIIHDTGVFKYNCTGRRTMEIATLCMETGIGFGDIIDKTFYSMEFQAKKLLGQVLAGMSRELDGRIVYCTLDRKTMNEAGITCSRDTDGFIDNIRTTDGALGAAFFYQLPDGSYKASLRSNTQALDVSAIAAKHDGGGHRPAAGCTLRGDIQAGIRGILEEMKEQLSEQ